MSKKRATKKGTRKRTTKRAAGRGRPQGSRTKQKPLADAEKSRCPRCHSTERERYFGTHEVDASGLIDGKPYNKVIFRRTACASCGQHRSDRSFEFDPEREKRKLAENR